MKTLCYVLALGIATIAPPVEAQTLPGAHLDRLRRSFRGCDLFGSCITVTVDLTQAAPENEFYQGTVSWRARFVEPAWTLRFMWGGLASSSYWEFGGGLFGPALYETGTVWEAFRAARYDPEINGDVLWLPWRPTEIFGIIQYPISPDGVYGDPTHDVGIDLTVTPEPASLLLVASALVGVAGIARRRRGGSGGT